jgi:hypothetical protein
MAKEYNEAYEEWKEKVEYDFKRRKKNNENRTNI